MKARNIHRELAARVDRNAMPWHTSPSVCSSGRIYFHGRSLRELKFQTFTGHAYSSVHVSTKKEMKNENQNVEEKITEKNEENATERGAALSKSRE